MKANELQGETVETERETETLCCQLAKRQVTRLTISIDFHSMEMILKLMLKTRLRMRQISHRKLNELQ